ncbi:hypothetical protein MNBD_GAMMA08-2263 [hydrothermal vent metagenome]|uniref:Uncharacterized protein n=1 Tax=hydrothermal vent metagenome TaxID=652676 RepID=A0A3B0Y0H7_9ZZZZ
MIKTFFSILLFTFYSSTLYGAEHNQVKIKTVDIHDKPFNVQTVRWWHADNRTIKQTLNCNKKECDEWLLTLPPFEHIIISADASTANPKDRSCWKLYHGEVSLTAPLKEIKIVMHYNNMACK